MVRDLDQRALVAAGAVAAAHGLEPDDAVVIYSGSNVLVHLRPAPVLARVMTGTVVLHDDPSRWLKCEISVLEFLAPSGLAVAPSRLIAPGPYHHDGLWMTFSELIAGVEPVTQLDDARRLGQALRDLHDALRPFDGELGDLHAVREDIERLHGQLRATDAHEADVISSLRVQLDALGEVVFESTLPTQALHGDVSLSNLLRTPQRLLWNDFQDTFRGPVQRSRCGRMPSVSLHPGSLRMYCIRRVEGLVVTMPSKYPIAAARRSTRGQAHRHRHRPNGNHRDVLTCV
jgi:Phosphotransferase enzyme family